MTDQRARTVNFWLSIVLLVAFALLGLRVALQGKWIIMGICILMVVSQAVTLWRLMRRPPAR